MDRVLIYPGQIPLETDLLGTNKNTMVALSKLSAAMLGTSTIANGLACVPTGPASLQVVVNPGEVYSLQNVDGTAYSSIAADTTHQIMKQGILLDAATLNCPAPGTGGQSINYLIQATYQDSDLLPVVLPYYNASNPASAYSGPNNAGTTNNTIRKGVCTVSAKAGTAATTGSQTTPAADAGYIGLWVVTVANGQTTITAGNITSAANASILPGSMLTCVQGNLLNYATDTGTANTYVVSYTPAITVLKDGMVLWFNAKTANTGASTVAVNGLGAVALVGAAQSALQGGEIIANGRCMAIYNATINSFVLIECTGAAVQVSLAAQSQHAVQFSQLTGVTGSMRNATMSIPVALATATFTADEIIVGTALGGLQYHLANFNKTINLAITGAGGMDVGAAPVSGYVSLYAIYNPTTQTSAILACAQATSNGSIYTGANMPSGYTASALISSWRTGPSSQFLVGFQTDRLIATAGVLILNNPAASASPVSFSIATAVPLNAKTVSGSFAIGSTAAPASASGAISASALQLGAIAAGCGVNAANQLTAFPFANLPVVANPNLFYTLGVTSGTAQLQFTIYDYTF